MLLLAKFEILQGAEIVAGGSIQVYGTLRGRARLEGAKNAPQRRPIEVP
jgi:septum formation inhibitor MinC